MNRHVGNRIVLREAMLRQGHSVRVCGEEISMNGLSRRQVLAGSAGRLAIATLGVAPAQAANNAQDLIKAFTGGKQATEGKVKLDLPEIAENGNTVPMTVTVESPMTEQSHVTEVLVLADGNPNAGVRPSTSRPRAASPRRTRASALRRRRTSSRSRK
jgi:sulfur-oxidizing protein SoxY